MVAGEFKFGNPAPPGFKTSCSQFYVACKQHCRLTLLTPVAQMLVMHNWCWRHSVQLESAVFAKLPLDIAAYIEHSHCA